MFVDPKREGEVTQAPAKVMKLSEAIRIGCEYVVENQLFSGCAIGTGYTALTGRNLSIDYKALGVRPCALVAEAFGVPEHMARRASAMHYSERKTREQCADYLESEGY